MKNDGLQPKGWIQAILYRAMIKLAEWKYKNNQVKLKKRIDREKNKR